MKTTVQKWAAFFGVLFLAVFVLTNIPAFNDDQGRNFGLFKIDPIDNIIHLLTALIGIGVGWKSVRYSIWFLIVAGILYEADAVVGMLFSQGLLDTTLIVHGAGHADFSSHNFYMNFPHILISTIMIIVGFKYKGVAKNK